MHIGYNGVDKGKQVTIDKSPSAFSNLTILAESYRLLNQIRYELIGEMGDFSESSSCFATRNELAK